MQAFSYSRKTFHIRGFFWKLHNPARSYSRTQYVRSGSIKASSNPPPRIIFSGIQPTGVPHLGNFLGAFRPWVKLQNGREANDKLNFSVVDLHALTTPLEPNQLNKWSLDTYIALVAAGLDPKISRIFFQSEIRGHTELMWILSTLASTGYLSRMTQWKSKLNLPENATLHDNEAKSALKLGLFSYPVLQAADVLLYESTHVPVGEDQQQHIEFARTLAGSFNHAYGEIFKIPQAVISPARRIMSLTDPTKKMSKSDLNPNSRISITDDRETIQQKFRTALTDSQDGISYDPERRPGVSNLLDILRHTRDEGASGNDLAAEFKDSSLRSLKEAVADAVTNGLCEVREKFLELRSNPKSLQYEMRLNYQRVASIAGRTLVKVKDATGLRQFYASFEPKPFHIKPVEE